MLKDKSAARGGKGLHTRERLLGAAIAEFKRDGMAAADVASIVSAAGVAHGTFFFHFPTKEHVLIELEKREEERMAAELTRFFKNPHSVRETLAKCVQALADLERRLGNRLFKDFLALHFSSTRPPAENWDDHPILVVVINELEQLRSRGDIPADVDVMHNGVSFLLGLYALLLTMPASGELRRPALDEYLITYTYGLRTLRD